MRILSKKTEKDIDNNVYFVAMGGLEHVGMNMYLYKYKGKYLMVDAGMGFLEDMHEGADTKYPDVSYLEGKKKDLVGIVITHGHEDHIGALKYIWPKFRCPIYCTRFVKEILVRDFKELGIAEPYDIRVYSEKGDRLSIGPFEIETFHVSHSVPEANMVVLYTDQGKILHTGDWTFNDGIPIEQQTDYAAIKRIGSDPDLLAVIGDSTEISRQEIQITELEVRDTMTKIFKSAPARVIVSCYSRSLARLKMIAEAAKAAGRLCAVKGRSLEEFLEIGLDLEYFSPKDFVPFESVADIQGDKVVIVVTGTQGEQYSMMSRLCRDEVKEMKLTPTDEVLFSAIIIPGNEKDVSFIYNRLAQKGIKTRTIFDTEKLHANGHAGTPEFKRFYEMVHPFIVIPMHGDYVNELLHAKMAMEVGGAKHMSMLKNGEMLALQKGSAPWVAETIHTGSIVIEGTKEYAGNDPIFSARKKVMLNGAVFVSMPVDKKGFLKGVPEVSSTGIFETDDTGYIRRQIQIAITKTMEDLGKAERKSQDSIIQNVNRAINGVLRPIIGQQKKPKIVVHFIYK